MCADGGMSVDLSLDIRREVIDLFKKKEYYIKNDAQKNRWEKNEFFIRLKIVVWQW